MTAPVPAGHNPCWHRRYRLTCAEYNELYVRANGCCEVCEIPEAATPDKILCTDHDHDPALGLWAVRGLLCTRCNTLEGAGKLVGPRAEAYFANPWYLGRRGLVGWPDQPPVGAVIRLGQTQWKRSEDGWRSVYEGATVAITWTALTERFAPDELTILPTVDSAAVRERLIGLGRQHGMLLSTQPRDDQAIRRIQRLDLADAIRAAHGAGFTAREIARWTGCMPDRVTRLWREAA